MKRINDDDYTTRAANTLVIYPFMRFVDKQTIPRGMHARIHAHACHRVCAQI